ncbi:ComEC/Rec2 family competence protein [Pelagibius sp. Alg239-R121]|uniref:ComEC/Rec2 family competence protein n=1 Tax=Pelagibius sp. Alg239-R121 TaxID=2993448 RepID=UPI0024A73F8B|nr:ComEC/Rec2 family competence protein [Pelagibius sp. Alg239-R121]
MAESAVKQAFWRRVEHIRLFASATLALKMLSRTNLLDRLHAERDRWALWLPVFFGCGIGAYFSLPIEPPPLTGLVLFAPAFAALIVLRKSQFWGALFLAGVFVLLGFSIAQWRSHSLKAPILERSVGPVEVRGRVVSVEPRSRGERLVLERPKIGRPSDGQTPARIRITLSSGAEGLYPGDWVVGTAKLGPPPEPAMPGAYDFARAAYFQRLGGVGFAYGRFEKLSGVTSDAGRNEAALPGRLARRWEIWWADLRHRLSERIVDALPGRSGAVAAALMTGERGRVAEGHLEALRDAGLAHLLAISGLHIGLVAAGLFFGLRGLLALIPGLALNYPIKKWAALTALPGAFAYLMLVGATIPAQRAFLMTGLMLLAVLLDRRALSMRLVAWAAMATLLLAPESLLSVSFQMSFAAVTLMIAAYEGQRGRFLKSGADFWSFGSLVRYLIAIAVTSAIATVATAPFAVYHFNHLALYGVFANVVAVPITAFWIMPSALLAFLMMPFGLEALPLWVMGIGIELVIGTAEGVSAWPSAALTVSAMPDWGIIAAAAGGLWLAIWSGTWRFLGVIPLAAAAVSVALWAPPDILVSADARLLAVRLADGSMWRSNRAVNRFAADIWYRRAGIDPDSDSKGRADGKSRAAGSGLPQCDTLGCIFYKESTTVALARTAGAITEDCALADLMVSLVPVRIDCKHPKTVIDRFDLWRNGTHAIWINDAGIRVETVAKSRGTRPWVQRRGATQAR